MFKKFVAMSLMVTGMVTLAPAQNLTPQQRTQMSNRMLGIDNGQSGKILVNPEPRLLNIFQRLLQGTSRRDVSYQLYIEGDNNTINAYALPDGRVVLVTGLINALPAGDDNALAFVMAHEISHIEKHHAEKLATQGGLTNVALGWLTQGQSDLLQGLAGVGEGMLTSGYSRGMEAEADGNGLDLMHAAGYSPRGALVTLQLFKDLEEQQGAARIFPTHPSAENRLNDARTYVEQHGY